MEVAQLHKANQLLEKYENKTWQQVIPNADFPEPISLHENIEYVRAILGDTVQFTGLLDDYVNVNELPQDANFYQYQKIINPTTEIVPSHNVIDMHIRAYGMDYRYEVKPNPIKALRSRTVDNTSVGRKPDVAQSSEFFCNFFGKNND